MTDLDQSDCTERAYHDFVRSSFSYESSRTKLIIHRWALVDLIVYLADVRFSLEKKAHKTSPIFLADRSTSSLQLPIRYEDVQKL